MRTLRTVLIALLMLLALPAVLAQKAQDTRPTEKSVRELLALMQARNMINTAMKQMDATMRPMMQKALAGRQQLSEREQQIVGDAHERIQAVMREELRWDNFEPMMISAYRNTFSQKEVDGMKAFYSSPIGQAVIAKMPLVTQQTMQAMQGRMVDMIPRIQQIQMDMAAQLKAEREAQSTSGEPQPQGAPSPTPQ